VGQPTRVQSLERFDRLVRSSRRQSISETELVAVEIVGRYRPLLGPYGPETLAATPFVLDTYAAYRADRLTPARLGAAALVAEQVGPAQIERWGYDPTGDYRDMSLELMARMARDLRNVSVTEKPARPTETFGSRLQSARLRRGLTQVDLAVAVDCSPSAIRAWEHDDRMPVSRNVRALAKALRIRPQELTDD